MLLLAKLAAKILSILNGEESPNQVSAGFAYGIIVGLAPLTGMMGLFLMLFGFVININLAIMGVTATLVKIFAVVFDPLANRIGFHLLTKVPGLTPFWTDLYNMPVVPYTKFNNTIVLGSLVIGLLLFVPSFFIFRFLLLKYRVTLKERVVKWKIVQAIQTSTLYRFYLSYKGFTGQ